MEKTWIGARQHALLGGFETKLLQAYLEAGKKAEAAALIEERLQAARKAAPADSPQLAGTLAITGLTLLQFKVWAEAEPILRECLAIREKKEPDDWRTFNAKSMLGGSLLGQKKYADAEPLLLSGYEEMIQREAKIPPQAKDLRLREALERLVQLYDALNKPAEAATWRQKLSARKQAEKNP